MTAMTVL